MVTADVFDQRIIHDFSQSLSVPRCEEMWTVSSLIVPLRRFVGIYIYWQYIVNIMIVHVDNIHIFKRIVVKWLGLVCFFFSKSLDFKNLLYIHPNTGVKYHVSCRSLLLRNRYILENKYKIILNVYLRYCLSVRWPK